MTNENKYPLPREIKDMFEEVAVLKLAMRLVPMITDKKDAVGKAKEMLKLSRKAEYTHKQAWEAVYKMYPELRDGPLAFDGESGKLVPRGSVSESLGELLSMISSRKETGPIN